METLIDETLEVGNVSLLLESGLVTGTQILSRLRDQKNGKSLVAFSHICKKENPNLHAPFLQKVTEIPEFGMIYLLLGGGMMDIIYPSVLKYHTDFAFRKRVNLIVGHLVLDEISSYTPEEIELAVSNKYPYLYSLIVKSSMKNEKLTQIIIEHDQFDFFKFTKSIHFLNMLMQRCRTISEKAPVYFECILKPKYDSVLGEFCKKYIKHCSAETLRLIRNYFPHHMDEKMLNLSDLALKIYLMPPVHQAYLLGFDISLYQPNERELLEALYQLSQGEEPYLAKVAEYNKNRMQVILPSQKVFELVKETDVLENSIYEYNIVDLVGYVDNQHYYIFTRPEFDNLLTSGKHFYTQNPIPNYVASMMKIKLTFAEEHALPRGGSLRDYYRLILNNEKLELTRREEAPMVFNLTSNVLLNHLFGLN